MLPSRNMQARTVPAPADPQCTTAVLRSDLERRVRREAKFMPHIIHGILIHALWPGGYTREALASTSAFLERAKQDVCNIEAHLRAAVPHLLCDRFQLIYRFGDTYRRLWKEHQEQYAKTSPPTKIWAEQEERDQSGMRDDERTTVYFHVGEDLAKPQTLTFNARTFMEVFILGNVMRRLVAKGVDPSNTSVWARLPNGSLLNIHWYDALPIPAPPFERTIHLELHGRGWRAPPVKLNRLPTGISLLCAFYNPLSSDPLLFHLPILEGGWVELSQARNFLTSHGVDGSDDLIILRGSTVNPSCQLEMVWDDPIPVPSGDVFALVFRFVCRACLLLEPMRTIGASRHFCR